MTSVDPRHQLAAALQAQIAAVRQRRASPAGSATSQVQSARTEATALTQRIRALDGNDPDRRQKAVRLFLESEFAREFGDALLNDPALPQMVEAVQAQMAADAQTAAAVNALGDLLLAGSGR